MNRITALTLALIAAGTVAQADVVKGRDYVAPSASTLSATVGTAVDIKAADAFDAESRALLGLNADDKVSVTAFETTGAIETSSTR